MDRFAKVIVRCCFTPLLFYLPVMHHIAKAPEKYTIEKRYSIAMRFVAGITRHAKAKIAVFGLENLPKDSGYLICPNHQDKFDPLAIWMSHPGRTSVVVAAKACNRPIISSFVPMINGIKLPQDDLKGMYAMSQEVQKLLEQNENCILFPEGDYESDCPSLMPFMNGCFKSPMRAKKPIVPVAIVDSFKVYKDFTEAPVHIQVHYLKPIYPEEYEGLKTRDVSEMVRSRIQAALDEFQAPRIGNSSYA